MKTLVDCGCTTKVYDDGSGVEIYYCPLHAAAPELLQMLRDVFAASVKNGDDIFPPALMNRIDDTIKKATGESS